MHELYQFYPQLDAWHKSERQIAIATVTTTWGSSPRREGAIMAITDRYEMIGSVSAGCVESAVVEAAQEVIRIQAAQHLDYGVSDELALDVGLACGGKISIYVQPYPKTLHQDLADYIQSEKAFTWHSIQNEMGISHHLSDNLQSVPVELEISPAETRLSQKVTPPLTLIIVGANHIAIALAQLAKVMGYRIIIVDPRTAFASTQRFPNVDRIMPLYPHKAFPEIGITAASAIAILAHDPKIDDIALELALNSSAFYVGALGGRKTQKERRIRLANKGLSFAAIDRLHGPIGLDIGAETPEQIALSILSEIVAAQNKRS